jgi:O-antigen/teichoic acid export membrane protein
MALATVIRREFVAELVRGPVLLAVAGSAANGLNLVMNLVLARILDPSSYGAVVVQTNIYMVLAVVGTAVLTAVVHRDLAKADGTRSERRGWIRRLRGVIRLAALAGALLALVLCRPVAVLLSYPHPFAIAEAAIAAALWVSVCIERGLLQARRNYPGLAWNLVVETVFRVTCVVAAVSAGFGVDGAGLGLVVGAVAGAASARRTVARTPSLSSGAPRVRLTDAAPAPAPRTPAGNGPIAMVPAAAATPRRTRDILIADTSVALATLVPLALMQNIDVVTVGWLNPAGVGGYAAISTACKIPVFLGLAVANYLLAEAARRRREGLPARRELAMALGVVVTPGLALAAVGAVAGRQLLSLLFGPELATAAPALWVLALATTLLSVTLLFAAYLLGAGSRNIVWVLAGCTPLATVVLVLADGAIMRTAVALLVCQAVTAALAGTLVLRLHRAQLAAHPASGDEPARPPAEPLGEDGTVTWRKDEDLAEGRAEPTSLMDEPNREAGWRGHQAPGRRPHDVVGEAVRRTTVPIRRVRAPSWPSALADGDR